MEEIIVFISNFEGIIGTLLGVIVTFALTNIFKNIGRVKAYFNEYEDKYWRMEKGAIEVLGIREISKAEYYDYSFRIELYNNSESIKILRNLKLKIDTSKKVIYGKLNDSSKKEVSQYRNIEKEVNIINVPPKQIVEFSLEGSVEISIDEDEKINKVSFYAENEKGKSYKKIVKNFMAS